jgi:transcriptional regulator with XRE-family HTH domain
MSDWEEYRQALYRLRDEAGWPTYRQIAERTGINWVYVGRILNGAVRGKWETVEAIVLALGGDPDEIKPLHEAMSLRGDPGDPGPPTQAELSTTATFLLLATALASLSVDDEQDPPECCMPDGPGCGPPEVVINHYVD